MSIRFRCSCGQKLKTRGGTEGWRVKCSNCLASLRIPGDGMSTYETIAELYPSAGDAPPAGASQGVSAAPAAPDAAGPSGLCVLIAESNPEDRRKVVRFLRERKYRVLEAADGRTALDMIRAERPAAVLLNVHLDLVSGFQVIQQLRSTLNVLNKDVWDTPALLTAERLHGRDKQYSMTVGAHGYFVKPLNPAEICRKLENIAAKRHSQNAMSRPLGGRL